MMRVQTTMQPILILEAQEGNSEVQGAVEMRSSNVLHFESSLGFLGTWTYMQDGKDRRGGGVQISTA